MKKKTYIIKYLTKNTTTDEKTIRKDLRDFWKRYPQHGVDGIYGYILNGRWEYRNRADIAQEVLQDVQNAGIKGDRPRTERYWVILD